jgi:DNA topoisomerase IB
MEDKEKNKNDSPLSKYVKKVIDDIYKEENDEKNFVYNSKPDKVIVIEQKREKEGNKNANE